jgi:hypothetical protein
MHRTLRLSVVAATAITLVAALTAPASAHGHTKPLTSATFAGYSVTKTKSHITSVTTTFQVPSITCKKNFSGVGPSIGVQSVIKKKNVYTDDIAGVGVGCENKQPAYESIIQVGRTSWNDLTLAAGDKVTLTVTTGKKNTAVTVDDVTSGAHKTRTGPARGWTYTYIGDQFILINHKRTGLDPFNTTTFSRSEINGKSLTKEKAIGYDLKHGKTLLIAVSKVTNGKTFVLTFEHS